MVAQPFIDDGNPIRKVLQIPRTLKKILATEPTLKNLNKDFAGIYEVKPKIRTK